MRHGEGGEPVLLYGVCAFRVRLVLILKIVLLSDGVSARRALDAGSLRVILLQLGCGAQNILILLGPAPHIELLVPVRCHAHLLQIVRLRIVLQTEALQTQGLLWCHVEACLLTVVRDHAAIRPASQAPKVQGSSDAPEGRKHK